MKLAGGEAHRRLVDHDHGVLCTVHARRGDDAVPVVYAVRDEHLAVPVDRVKPKSGSGVAPLQRERNLYADPRATLLIEQWDSEDWSQLWWVRSELEWDADVSPEVEEALATGLADRYVQYRDRPFDRLLVFRIVATSGWAAV